MESDLSADAQQSESVLASNARAMRLRLLMVEDNPADADLVVLTLQDHGFEVLSDVVQSPEEGLSRLRETEYDVVLADYNLPKGARNRAADILSRGNRDIPLIVVSGNRMGEETVVDYIKQGATDFVFKERLNRLPTSIRRALEEKRNRDERLQFEKQLADKVAELSRANAELARSNEELEQFAYVASHDLKEPLRMVESYNRLLADRYQGKLDAQADKFIQYSVDGVDRMQNLIRDLLALSRVGKTNILPILVDCGTVVQEAVDNLKVAIEDGRATVNWNGLPMVLADRQQLALVFQNLIANGIDFHASAAPVVEIYAEKIGTDWQITVSDNGLGIPHANREEVFVIFRRLHNSPAIPGTGIGLSICRKIIERHGGKLWIENQANPGSCFRFTLPVEGASFSESQLKPVGDS